MLGVQLWKTSRLLLSSIKNDLIDRKSRRRQGSLKITIPVWCYTSQPGILDLQGRETRMPYPMARPDDPVHLKNFDPKTFYPAVAIRGDSLDTSIYPSSSISQTETQAHHAGIDQPRPALRHTESWLRKQQQRNRLRIWMISLCFFVAIGVLIAVFAWLGSNNWFKHANE